MKRLTFSMNAPACQPGGAFGVLRLAVLAAGLLSLSLPASLGQTVFTARKADGSLEDPALYREENGNWQNSSVKSSAPGLPERPGSRFNTTLNSAVVVEPVLPRAGGEYFVEVTTPGPASQTADAIVSVQTQYSSGLPETTEVFRNSEPNTWKRIGKLTLDPDQDWPSVRFTFISGTGRFYFDGIRFVDAGDPCLNGLPELAYVMGPLADGQTSVDVPNIDAGASKVSVYSDGTLIGEKTADIAAGTNRVDVTALTKGALITATQTNGEGVESCRPATGQSVGGGPNSSLRFALSIRENETLTGPVGADGGVTGDLKMLGAVSAYGGGFGAAPDGGDKIVDPDLCWQTLTFLRGDDPLNPIDPTYGWAGVQTDAPLHGNYGVLDSIAIAIEEENMDTGPYRIYFDNVMNGGVLIEDFEGFEAGAEQAFFNVPSFSGSTPAYLMASPGPISPDVSVVSDVNADTGSKSAQIEWQFVDTSGVNWLRLGLYDLDGTPRPIVDLTEPITFRVLILPVGETEGAFTVTQIGDRVAADGSTVTLSVEVTKGEAATSYQWMKAGEPIDGATDAELVLPNVTAADEGAYSVAVSNGTCSTTSYGTLSLGDVVPEIAVSLNEEGQVVLSWEGAFTLQAADTVDGEYIDITGAASGHAVDPAPGTQKFFRLSN